MIDDLEPGKMYKIRRQPKTSPGSESGARLLDMGIITYNHCMRDRLLFEVSSPNAMHAPSAPFDDKSWDDMNDGLVVKSNDPFFLIDVSKNDYPEEWLSTMKKSYLDLKTYIEMSILFENKVLFCNIGDFTTTSESLREFYIIEKFE